ncbi:Trk system potassium transporter TrkA [Cerasicoccus arenae]|uniref:Trk system potassium uptake protein TrkA n=1 Tax=Cerasicoccus arenae TaxID=424488 RepID=A0A8J3DH02_9BACT|nr:Trk system potassium transporter TrkA [Cerasicoccus arenae]MBK1859131.1 Trk system potassium transporter TrkA [Cerasicoccus arenae]GHB98020.1 Trk system potassium transport protein TrkA [Cerasicoccus arenae]
MKILVVGAGEVGRFLCEKLSEGGHDVTVIDNNPAIAQDVDESLDVRVVEDHGASAGVLKKCGAGECHFFLAMTSDDRTNLIACSLAKALGAKTTIARIHDQTYSDNSIVNYQIHFGIDFLLNPEALSAVELAKSIRNPSRVAVENFARGEIEVQQIRISPRSKLAGKSLREIRLPEGVRICLIQDGESSEVPTADSKLELDQCVTLVGPPEPLVQTKSLLSPEKKTELLRIVLFGGSETSIALIRLLKNPRFKIRLIEHDAKLCQKLAERFPHITVIHGSATSLRLMEEEQVGAADYFVACTKDDEDNIMTCLQARQLGVKHVQLVINKPDYEEILDQMRLTLGVELAVAPRQATVAEIMRYISTEPFTELASLPEGRAKILEIRVSPESPVINKTIREISFPKGAVIVVLLHKFLAKVPGADDKILSGDRVVVVVREDREKELLKLLT